MKRNPVGWFEIYVGDMKRAKSFYESVFKLKLEKLNSDETHIEMWSFPGKPDVPGSSGALCCIKGVNPGQNSVMVYFSCDDCAVEEARVKEFGGQIHKPKFSIGHYGHISLVHDTEGNMFGLHSMK